MKVNVIITRCDCLPQTRPGVRVDKLGHFDRMVSLLYSYYQESFTSSTFLFNILALPFDIWAGQSKL